MDLNELRQLIGHLTASDLEQLGINERENFEKFVKVRKSSRQNDETYNESALVTSIASDDINVVIIANGVLYDAEAAEETGKSAEISRIYLNEEKADMILDAIKATFGHLLEHQECREERAGTEPEPEQLPVVDVDVDADSDSMWTDSDKVQTIDGLIGSMQNSISRLKQMKADGYELIDGQWSGHATTVFPGSSPKPSADAQIETHQKIIAWIKDLTGSESVHVAVPPKKGITTYRTKNGDTEHIIQLNVEEATRRNNIEENAMVFVRPPGT